MQLKEILKYKKETLAKEIKALEEFEKKVPEGKIVARKRDGKFYYGKRLPKEEQIKKGPNFVERYLKPNAEETMLLAKGEYGKHRLKDAYKELAIVNEYLEMLNCEPNAEKFLRTHEGIRFLIEPKLIIEEEELKKWQEMDYKRSEYKPEKLIYPTVIPSLQVRSKSEADIISRLVHFNVPFHYEEEIQTPNGKRVPDFKCKAISTHKIWYWEHFGGMNSFKYAEKNIDKLKDLYSAGIVQWKNLIITTETVDNPLDINWVDEIIKYYLL